MTEQVSKVNVYAQIGPPPNNEAAAKVVIYAIVNNQTPPPPPPPFAYVQSTISTGHQNH